MKTSQFCFPAIILLMMGMSSMSILAQAPELISYQAVIRNPDNQLDTNSMVGMKISILKGSPDGQVVYSETHSAMTNENGLVSVEIGAGVAVSGVFASVNWANGPYFARVETDPDGGENYLLTITSRLLSVPYALYAKKSGSANETDPVFANSLAAHITANDTSYWNHKMNAGRYVGELYGGGVVFYVDRSGQHGLIVAMEPPPGYGQWSNVSTDIGAAAQSDWNGQGNTNAIIAQPGHNASAAKECSDYVNTNFGTGVYSDWYLPAMGELIKLYVALYEVNKALDTDGNSATSPVYKTLYWSSNEYNNTYAYYCDFINGNSGYTMKSTYMAVRAIRAF